MKKRKQKATSGRNDSVRIKTTTLRKERTDFHHLLFQEKHWQQGYGKLLRDHPYMGAYIPQETLHSLIHSKIHDVPVPNAKECRQAYNLLQILVRKHRVRMDDPLEKRLNILIQLWEQKCPATVAILVWQRDIIAKYRNEHPEWQ